MPLAVYVLSLGIFSMTTSEFMVSGMMPILASAFGVSIAAIGYLVSAYAIGMIVGGPVLTFGLLKLSRKNALLILVGVYVVGQSLGALASGYEMMFVARIVTGVASSAFFGVALAVCAELVGPDLRGRASSIVLGGLMVGTVLGLPLATLIGQHAGWRVSFWSIAALTLVAGFLVLRIVPTSEKPEAVSLGGELGAFRNAKLWAAYASSTLIIGAVFAAFSYFTPIFIEVTGFSAEIVPLLLTAYGASTVIGNVVVGRFADRHMMSTLVVGVTTLAVFLTGFALLAGNKAGTVVCLVAVGLVGVSLNPAMVTRVMRAANGRPLVNTVHTSVINVGVLLGSWIGGMTITGGFGLVSPLWVGASLALLALLSLLPFVREQKAAPVIPAYAEQTS